MGNVKAVSVSELLQLARPLTGASFPQSLSSAPPPLKKHKSQPSEENPNKTPLLSEKNTTTSTFTPLKHPVLLVGTIHLSSDVSDLCDSRNHCLSFYDGSFRVCCDILDLDLHIIGRKINVLAWNFLPFKRGGGILEIIKWTIPDLGTESQHNSLQSIPSPFPRQEIRVSHLCIWGALRSVSPVFSAPSMAERCDCQDGSCGKQEENRDVTIFLAEMTICECQLSGRRNTSVTNPHCPQKGLDGHSFTKSAFVYFQWPNSSWYPMLCKLIGYTITISGMKKKQVFVGEDELYMMFVATEKVIVQASQSPTEVMSIRRRGFPRRGELGIYSGVVTGIYMQGMVVELDEKVWLLVTDPLLDTLHSLRVGAIISVRNVHFVHPKFSWIRMLLLGACVKTSIVVKFFSPSDTRLHFRSQSRSLLVNFVESLTFFARFWVLLLISCFKKKFAGFLMINEILGARSQEGLAQIYARSCLPPCAFQHRHGVFMEFCKYDQCGSSNKPNYAPLKLVVPISNFISKCQLVWVAVLPEMHSDVQIIEKNDDFNDLICEAQFYRRLIRRIIPSNDLGVILMGVLKISPCSGRLQLVDSTGSIDVVIPDLQTDIDEDIIYEVKDYELVLEGLPMDFGPSELHMNEPFSCRSIFQHSLNKDNLNELVVYVHFYLKNTTCLNVSFPLPSSMVSADGLTGSSGAIFNLLVVTHKFPATNNIQDRSSLFAEALVLPYKLILLEEDGDVKVPQFHADKLEAQFICSEDNLLHSVKRGSKRPKLDFGSSSSKKGFGGNQKLPCKHSCLLSFGNANFQASLVPTNLLFPESMVIKQSARRVLLEFKSDSFNQYQLLQIGEYYILKSTKKELLRDMEENNELVTSCRVLVTCQTPLWSLSFSFGEAMLLNEQPEHQSSVVSSFGTDLSPFENFFLKELWFHQNLNRIKRNSDAHLYISDDTAALIKEGKFLDLLKPHPELREIFSVSSCIKIMDTSLYSFGAAGPKHRLPEGNLISFNGNVMDAHFAPCNSTDINTCWSHEAVTSTHQLHACYICIHVCDDHHMVKIRGAFNKYAYPLAMGPGVNATFHRVLMTCTTKRWLELKLVPVSFIIVNSIKEVNHEYSYRGFLPESSLNSQTTDVHKVSLSLISQSNQHFKSKVVQFRCRVMGIYVLVLEKSKSQAVNLQTVKQLKIPAVKIPLAGFILDDGSSSGCCCWANAERAEMLLRLHDYAFQARNSISSRSSKRSIGYQLNKMLKKHRRITIKNFGALVDSSCADFTFSVDSSKVFSISNEKLLKLIILKAYGGPNLDVVANRMDFNALSQSNKELIGLDVMHSSSMQNVWAREVSHVDPRKEANKILDELLKA